MALEVGAVVDAVGALGAAAASDWAGPPSRGNGFATRFAEDLALAAELGLSTLVVELDWARLEPREGRWDRDAEEWHGRLVETAAESGVGMVAVLAGSSQPGWFADEGGMGDDRARGRFWARHVDRCAEAWGDRLAGWVPLPDPVAQAVHPLAERGLLDRRRAGERLRGTLLGVRDAWRQLRGGPPVTLALGLDEVRRADETVGVAEAARWEEAVMWTSPARALRDGVLVIPGRPDQEVADLKGCCDRVAVVHGGSRVVLDPVSARFGHRPPTATTAAEALRRAAEAFPDLDLVLQVGGGAPTPEDAWREELLVGVAVELVDARSDGVPVTGLWWQTFVDPGWPSPAGVVDSDRQPRPSAHRLAGLRAL